MVDPVDVFELLVDPVMVGDIVFDFDRALLRVPDTEPVSVVDSVFVNVPIELLELLGLTVEHTVSERDCLIVAVVVLLGPCA